MTSTSIDLKGWHTANIELVHRISLPSSAWYFLISSLHTEWVLNATVEEFYFLLFQYFYFLIENAENKVLPQTLFNTHSVCKLRLEKYQLKKWNSHGPIQCLAVCHPFHLWRWGHTFDFVPRFVYSAMQLTKGIKPGLNFVICMQCRILFDDAMFQI